jgi:anti-sigma-K factor RskA
MSTNSWKEVSSQLRRQSAGSGPRPAAAFWADFKARAALTRQESPEAAGERLPSAWRWAYVAAVAVAVVAVGVYVMPAPASAVTRIKSLEVLAPHSGVIIMNDQSGKGTILWIAGMEAKNGSG